MINKNVVIEDELKLQLTIAVSDNGLPSLKGTGQAAITLIPFNNPPLPQQSKLYYYDSSGGSTFIEPSQPMIRMRNRSLHMKSYPRPDNHFRLDAVTETASGLDRY